MSLKVALQMDPIEDIDIGSDSSFLLGIEAQKRGYELFHYLALDLSLENGVPVTNARPMALRVEKGNHFTLGAAKRMEVGDFDVVLLRQDPPFDMSYITNTHLLEFVPKTTLITNDPKEVRNAPEKIFVMEFPDLMPPTLITRDSAAIERFRAEHKDIILKPLFGNGGAQVFHVTPDSDNLNALVEMFSDMYREQIMVQKYMPAVREGDKRIILIDGEPAGAILRVPEDGESRANLHAGASAVKTELTAREIEICERIGPELRKRGLVFVGIDVIGDYMTEINVTSPTGLPQINALDGVCLEAQIWDAFERRYEALQNG